MSMHTSVELLTSRRSISRGSVRGVDAAGYLLVSFGEPEVTWRCEVLLHSEMENVSHPGASVLVLHGDEELNELPIVLGNVGTLGNSQPEAAVVPSPSADVLEELVIEAKKNLTLKCGDGSITIRADGKILIKGKDLVSHAQRMNRIKGGSVSIN